MVDRKRRIKPREARSEISPEELEKLRAEAMAEYERQLDEYYTAYTNAVIRAFREAEEAEKKDVSKGD